MSEFSDIMGQWVVVQPGLSGTGAHRTETTLFLNLSRTKPVEEMLTEPHPSYSESKSV